MWVTEQIIIIDNIVDACTYMMKMWLHKQISRNDNDVNVIP